MADLQKCVVKALETCSEPTPANIVDSLFNFVRKMTPCAKFKTEDTRSETVHTGSATTTTVTGLTVIASIFVTFFTKILQHQV
jgi:hypothetical protein